jgi:serine/threonine protein kinase
MALETHRDGTFTKLSDLWSFGVVMWEIFSLGDIPYANILLQDSQLRQWLEDGDRLPVTAIGWSSGRAA